MRAVAAEPNSLVRLRWHSALWAGRLAVRLSDHFLPHPRSSHSGYIEVSDMSITFGQKVRDQDWMDLVKHYWLVLLVVLLAALIIVLMPIIG